MQLKQSLGVQTSARYQLKVYGKPGVLESSGKIGGPFFGKMFSCKKRRGGGYCVFFYHLVFKFQEFWFLPMLSHCFYQLVSFHLFHVLQKLTMTPERDDSPSSESLSGGQVLCEFFGEKSSISSSFCTQPKPHVISGYENIL